MSKFSRMFTKGCLQKKLLRRGHWSIQGEGGGKSPFLVQQKKDIFLWGEGSKSFCHMSHIHFCVSVSTQFVAVLEALHYEKNFFILQ